ncbi:MAG: DUF1552 domain-containing protein [Bdellovibrionales bacterium]
MSNFKLDRRKFISSTGLALMLPALEEFFPKAYAQAAGPKRFVSFYFANGTVNTGFGPSSVPCWGSAANGVLNDDVGPAFTPFLQYKSDFSLINRWQWSREFTDHASAPLLMFAPESGPTFKRSPVNNESTFDHMVATATQRKSYFLMPGPDITPESWHLSSFKDGKESVPLTNPGDLYRELLSVISPNAGAQSATKLAPAIRPQAATGALAGSILDNSLISLVELKGKLGRSSQTRLDEYLSAVRELELKMGVTPAPLPNPTPTPSPSPGPSPIPDPETMAGCVAPSPLASGIDSGKNPSNTAAYVARFKAFNDLIRIAFACDITRSVNIQFDYEASERPFEAPSNLIYLDGDPKGITTHTPMAHSVGSSDQWNARNVSKDRVLLSLVFDLVAKLKSTTDASGSPILDNTIIFGGHGCYVGNHSNSGNAFGSVGQPAFIAGGRNMMATGRGLDGTKFNRKDLFYTFSTLLGMNLPNFGGSSKLVSFT